MISKSYFSQEDYNRAVGRHVYKSYESSDKPEMIDIKKPKLKGKAFSILTHLRNFGFYISSIGPSNDIFGEECYDLLCRLSALVEFVMAPKIRRHEVAIFEEDLIEYLNLRGKIYKDYFHFLNKPKPKTHYLSHYAASLLLYGPSIGVCTSRYESKHRTAKMLASSAKNFVNIAKTLAIRQQYRLCSVYYNGMFETGDIQFPAVVIRKSEIENSLKDVLILRKLSEFLTEDAICTFEVKYKSQTYKSEDVIILEAKNNNEVNVGVIQAAIYKDETLYFLVYRYEALRDMKLRYFVTVTTPSPALCFVMASRMKDFKPLIKHGSFSKFKFCLHHYVSIPTTDE